METGQIISRRYLLQRVIQQGQFCTVYQGVDQLLQRPVAVKAILAPLIPAYKAAVRMTSQFSHPNVIGLYDSIGENDSLYLVQEYVEGIDFAALLQMQLPPSEVADIGSQICQALLYAASSTRKICHGDLTPNAILRDKLGYVRVNNFALPADLPYFTKWSVVGSGSLILSDRDLPAGLPSTERTADDTRAVGLLLYQLLTGHSAGVLTVEPPADGRLRFMRNVPPELCEVVARAVVRQHPESIKTPEVLYTQLKTLAETFEPPVPVLTGTPAYQQTELPAAPIASQFDPGGGNAVNVGSVSNAGNAYTMRSGGQPGARLASYMVDNSPEAGPSSPTIADIPLKVAAAREAAYPTPSTEPAPASQSSSFPQVALLLLLCIIAFAILFGVGYFIGHALFP